MNAAYLAIVGSFLGALIGAVALIYATRINSKTMLRVAELNQHAQNVRDIDHTAEAAAETKGLLAVVDQPTIAELQHQIDLLRAAQSPILTRKKNR